MMEGCYSFLYINTGPHFAGRADHDTNLALVHFLIKGQPLFLVFGIVNESDFILRYAIGDQLRLNSLVNIFQQIFLFLGFILFLGVNNFAAIGIILDLVCCFFLVLGLGRTPGPGKQAACLYL